MEVYHDYTYLELLRDVFSSANEKADRTGTGTLAVFSREMRFNLANNIIPVLTTKKIHLRSIVHELLWYLKGTGSGKYLKENNIRIWDEWMDNDHHLNYVYGYQWRRWPTTENSIGLIKQKPDVGINAPFVCDDSETLVPLYTGNPRYDDIIGSTFVSRKFGEYTVISKEPSSGAKNGIYKIQFHQTGTVITAPRNQIRAQQVRDPWTKTIFGEGCLGVMNEERLPYQTTAYNLWYNMMRRCHDPSLPEYLLYGGRGVFVDQQWRCFANFLHDIRYLPGFHEWVRQPNKYSLDKDYYGGKCYSKHTCVFISNKYNKQLSNHDGCKVVAIKGDNKIEGLFARDVAKKIGCTNQQVIDCLNHPLTNKTAHGYTITKSCPVNGTAYRKQLYIDQIAQAIDTIKNNPTSRRIIVSAWNVGLIDQMALPPCHAFFQFYVDNKTLSCKLTQRSCDVGLGVPFNIAQYSILVCMIAHVTGLQPGEFIWSGGDVHVYRNHVDTLKGQLERNPYPSPTLWLNPDVTDIDDFTYEDIRIENYKSHPALKMEVSV